MKNKYIYAAVFTFLIFQSCKKEKIDPPLTFGITKSNLVGEMQWPESGAKADLLYNPDSTLKTIIYQGQGSSYAVNYLYVDKRLQMIDLGETLYSYLYFYNNEGRIVSVKRKEEVNNYYNQDLVFSYNVNGTVAELKYYQTYEGAKKLIYTNTYTYNTSWQLKEITSVAHTGAKFIFKIESYSEPVSFNPLWFVGIDLNENYMIYNYPVLSRMHALPSRITKLTVKDGRPVVEQIMTINSIIKNGQLQKQHTVISYPQRPSTDSSSETLFNY
jgi:hypothetical protein